MARLKGWIHTTHSGTKVLCDIGGKDAVFVEEVPINAIRGTVIVEPGKLWHEQLQQLPAELFGKKISIIIIPEEVK